MDKKKGFFIHLIPYIIAISSALSTVVPHNSDDPIVQSIKLISDILALNLSHGTLSTTSNNPDCEIPK